MKQETYGPNKKSAPASDECEFHLRGCCFDPKKSLDGFFATPCFDCTSIDQDESVSENNIDFSDVSKENEENF